MPSFSAVVETGDLDGTTGFRLVGPAAASGVGFSLLGMGSFAVGDFNNDGYADLLIGAPDAPLDGAAGDGGAYIVFGGPTAAASRTLGTLPAAEGLAISGPTAVWFGGGVGGGFDVNGDGLEDFAVSAMNLTFNSSAVYVVYGQDGGFTGGSFNALSLDGDNGFRLTLSGLVPMQDIASAGDLNADGVEDLLITGAGAFEGSAYVLFGQQGGFAASLSLAGLNGTNGFAISNLDSLSRRAISGEGGGDINGDGIDDLVLGARYANASDGAAYIIFGRHTAADGDFAAALDIAGLDGSNGFALHGDFTVSKAGRDVKWLDDINGDGLDDLAITAPGTSEGSVFIVFGRDTALDGDFAANLDLIDLDGTDGFRLTMGPGATYFGVAVDGSEDINGDGFADLVVGALRAEADLGLAYVLFGGAAFDAVVDVTTLDGSDGFVIRGETAGDQLGSEVELADLNGDGLADIIIGARLSDLGGADSGAVYVIYGIQADLTLTGTAAAEAMNGNIGADTISGLAGEDVLHGLDGADILDGGDAKDQLYGGAGADDLLGGLGGDLLDGGTGIDRMVGGAGDDTYVVDDASDDCVELGGEGSDRVRAGVTFALGDNLDHLQLTGSADIDGTGNGLANQIDGNSGTNVLSGGAGGDLIRGYLGDDTLNGDTGADQLLGGDGADILDGGADNDRLDGGAGADTLRGGAGGDILEGGADGDQLFGDAGADQLNGGDGDDVLRGGADNDVLSGGAGSDDLAGGAGDDIYLFVSGDIVLEAAGEGIDTIRTATSYVLEANFERLILEGAFDIGGGGNGLDNVLTGNGGANVLVGFGGADTLNGGLGADRLTGGTGNDILVGGGGADRFIVLQESIGTSEVDTVSDYALGQDIIDLSAIDAIAGGANDAFSIVAGFTRAAGQMTLSFAGATTSLALDVDGDGRADYLMRINGDVRADTAGWLL
jgi:Ca2+-binding RTX toxin-like protein